MIRIVVADDHTIVREGLKQVLAAASDFQIVGEAQSGRASCRERVSIRV